MTVEELIDLLGQYDGDQEVRLAFQPQWPLAFEVGTVVSSDEFVTGEDDEDQEEEDEREPVVWISEGGHPSGESPYAPKAAFEMGGWR